MDSKTTTPTQAIAEIPPEWTVLHSYTCRDENDEPYLVEVQAARRSGDKVHIWHASYWLGEGSDNKWNVDPESGTALFVIGARTILEMFEQDKACGGNRRVRGWAATHEHRKDVDGG